MTTTSQFVGFRIPKPYTDYDWMHPSWRDLIIEHLHANKTDRERFLSRCGPQGVLLALSSAGGGKGTRETPLLVDAEDWTRLQATTLTLLKSAENSNEVRMVLRAIQDAMLRKAGTEQPRLILLSDPLHGLAMKSLETLRTKWDTGNCVISAATLSEYCRVSLLLSPLPPIPDMRPTWEDRWTLVKHHSSKGGGPLNLWTEAVSEWLDLVEIVTSSEPRLLRQVGFPKSYLDVVRSYLDCVERGVDSDFDADEHEDYDAEISRMEDLEPVAEQIGSVFSSLEDRAQVVQNALASAQSDISEKRDEKFSGPVDDYESGAPASRPSGGFDVDELFADL